MCYGALNDIVKEFRANFMHNKHNADSCKIRICSRCRTGNTCRWWQTWLFRDIIDATNLLHRVPAENSLGATQSRRYSVILWQGDHYSYCLLLILLFFYVKTDKIAESENELDFVQYLEDAPSLEENERELALFPFFQMDVGQENILCYQFQCKKL